MAVYLPVWNSHCTRVRLTVIVSCSDELAVHTCPFLCLQRRVAKVASGLFCCWSSLRNNNIATNLQRFILYYHSRRFVAWDCWTHTTWQLMQEDSDMLIAVSHVHLYFVKRRMSDSVAMLIGVDRGRPKGPCPPKFLENIVILCFETRFSKQNSTIRLKWNILVPPNFWSGYATGNASTSFKTPLLVRVWPMCLSVKLHLCRLLFMQYKLTWLVRIHLYRLVGMRLNC